MRTHSAAAFCSSYFAIAASLKGLDWAHSKGAQLAVTLEQFAQRSTTTVDIDDAVTD